MHPRGTIKAPASPHTTREGGADRDGAPRESEGERGAGISSILTAEFAEVRREG